MSKSFSTEVRVRYVECDMQGHVFNAHYLTWFDMAHTELLETALRKPWTEVMASGIDVVVAESGVKYLAPARFNDRLKVHAVLDPPTTSSFTTRFTVTRGEDQIARGFLRHVCVDASELKKRPIPDQMRTALAPYIAAADNG